MHSESPRGSEKIIVHITRQTRSIRSLFSGAFLVTFYLSQLGNFHTDVVLKLPVHSWFVAKFEKYFQMNEEGGKDKR